MSRAHDTMFWLVADWKSARNRAMEHRLCGGWNDYQREMDKANRLWEQIQFLRDRTGGSEDD